MIQRSYSILEKYFEDCVVADDMQGIFATKERYTKVISTLPDKDLRDSLFEHWEKHSRQTSVQRWNQLNDALSPPDSKKGKKHNHMELQLWRTELIFTYCYPRLDANVSKAQNHLLKSPFCVHPKTGRVCVPIDPVDPDSFDPFAVPTVRTLCEEMDAYKGDDSGNIPDVEKTSLNTALRLFDKSFMQGLREAIRKGFRDREEQVAAMNVDF
jgi:DNA primase small subunit